MGKLFGTDGVRGVANTELSCELAYKVGRVGGYVLTRNVKRPKIVVGIDTRISGSMLEGAVSSGLCSSGVDVLYVGVVPTPAVAYLVRKLEADGGVMISASHNPVEYNGIKFFDKNGYKLSDETEEIIEDIILNKTDTGYSPVDCNIGRKFVMDNSLELYASFLEEIADSSFKGIKVAVDCANGAAYNVAPELLKKMGATVYAINNNPDGLNINVNCGSTYPEIISQFVKDTGADVGLSFDGDADRLIAVDEKGEIVDGDHIMAVCGIHMAKESKLKNNTIVGTVMSNMGLDICLKQNEIAIVKTQVGDKYVLKEMKEHGYSLGGEQSGHIIFLEHNTTGDGLLTAIKLLEVIKKENKYLSELSSAMSNLPQVLINAKVINENKMRFMDDELIKNSISILESDFHGKGRVLIRPSGTEPLVRVMIEGENEFEIRKKALELSQLIESRLN